ncbi:MAG: ParB N-terminal domain-containing protein, partial [Pirellula sp.]
MNATRKDMLITQRHPYVQIPTKRTDYEILDGTLRYRILLDLGVESVPCLIHSTRDGFTGNRMVNQLSASQEMRMLRKSLEELDEKTIA